MMKQTKPDCRCTWFDLRDLSILPHGWVMIRREEPGLESFGIKYLGEGFDPLVKAAQLEDALVGIKERAERVKEGEDWDLAGYCIEVIDKALGGE